MKVLVIGGGGREHAIVHTLKKSPKVDHIWCAPGNGGIAAEAECVAIKATDIDGMVAFAKEHKPDLVMVAPDDPLALGMVWMRSRPLASVPSARARTPPSSRAASPLQRI